MKKLTTKIIFILLCCAASFAAYAAPLQQGVRGVARFTYENHFPRVCDENQICTLPVSYDLPVANAHVKAVRHDGRNKVYRARTNNRGRFSLALPIGTYTLKLANGLTKRVTVKRFKVSKADLRRIVKVY